MWTYNDKLKAWFHAGGARSDNPPDRMPTHDETMVLLNAQVTAEMATAVMERPAPGASKGCGCGGKAGERRAR